MKALYAIVGIIVGLVLGVAVPRPARVVEVNVPTPSVSIKNDTSGNLSGKTGDTFDRAFLDAMIAHHEDAVAMAGQALGTSKRPELVDLATAIISIQQKEITQMKEWREAWFGN
jgi:predicted outer membrane protein